MAEEEILIISGDENSQETKTVKKTPRNVKRNRSTEQQNHDVIDLTEVPVEKSDLTLRERLNNLQKPVNNEVVVDLTSSSQNQIPTLNNHNHINHNREINNYRPIILLEEVKPNRDMQKGSLSSSSNHQNSFDHQSIFSAPTPHKENEINYTGTSTDIGIGSSSQNPAVDKKGKALESLKRFMEGTDLTEKQLRKTLEQNDWNVVKAVNSLYEDNPNDVQCCICFDKFDKSDGLLCSKQHLLCWESCFDQYISQAKQPDASQYFDKEGNLACPDCKEAYELKGIAQNGPPHAFEALLDLRLFVQSNKAVKNAVDSERQRLTEEFEKIQKIQDPDTKEAALLQKEIVDNVLTLRCPRANCRTAFLDFDGCFALSCSVCKCGFCAWCLKDCKTNAHAHVATCSENTAGKSYYGTKQQFIDHHKKRRGLIIENMLRDKSENVKRKVLEALQTELKDLNIKINFNNPVNQITVPVAVPVGRKKRGRGY